jgi:hypothetical protein
VDVVKEEYDDDAHLDGLVNASTTSDDANAITATTAYNTAMTTKMTFNVICFNNVTFRLFWRHIEEKRIFFARKN